MKGAALFETMSQQVDAQCESNLSEAKRVAEAIVAEARAQCAEQRETVLSATKGELAALDERWRQKAEAEAAKAALVVKNEAMQDVLRQVDEDIRSTVKGPEFEAVLDALLAELMAVEEGGDFKVLAPEAHVDRVRNWLANMGRGSVPIEASSELWDGVALQDMNRTYRISNALTGRYSRVLEEARKTCMTSLFDDADNASRRG